MELDDLDQKETCNHNTHPDPHWNFRIGRMEPRHVDQNKASIATEAGYPKQCLSTKNGLCQNGVESISRTERNGTK
jgi:hypothetical protein